jgi:hypothetical protein
MEHETLEPNWTTVDRFFHPTDAHIAAGKLESEGIPADLRHCQSCGAEWKASRGD